jgi:tRNA(Ile2) C34 agmatinyltransferase TiaS
MIISVQAKLLLDRLLATGLYGSTVEDVMERLICQQIVQLVKDRVIIMPDLPSGPRCAKCGSPKINDLTSMGGEEYECLDCGHRWP